jgi:hypothetical protein
MAQYNMFVPRYADTVSANLQKGIDTLGAKIFTYDVLGEWTRTKDANGVKKWVQTSAGGGSGGTGNWFVSGNGQNVVNSLGTGGLGTSNGATVSLITSGQIRVVLPVNGLERQVTTGAFKYMLFDTTNKTWGYGDGGSGSTPTWQQTLTAGSTLTGNNTISGGGFDFTFGDSKEFIIGTTGSSAYFYADASRTGAASFQRTRPDSIIFAPHLGQLNIDTLRVATNENSLIGWQTSTGRTG